MLWVGRMKDVDQEVDAQLTRMEGKIHPELDIRMTWMEWTIHSLIFLTGQHLFYTCVGQHPQDTGECVSVRRGWRMIWHTLDMS